MRVLVLDDTAVVRAAVAKLVADHGYTVETAASLEEARAVDPASLDAAVVDVEIGTACGIDFATELLELRPELPVVFLTATSDPASRSRASSIAEVLDKTCGLEAVGTWIDAALAPRRGPDPM